MEGWINRRIEINEWSERQRKRERDEWKDRGTN